MSVVEIIQHYQRSIEKCSGNEERMLYCIRKLYRLPVTVQHLQETGVGRTVNALRKYVGDVGDAAKALVAKWKTMVADEESSDGDPASDDEANISEPPDDYGSQSHPKKNEKDSSDDRDDRNDSRSGNVELKDKQEFRPSKNESVKNNSRNGSSDKYKSKDSHSKSHSSSGSEKHRQSRLDEAIKFESVDESKDDTEKRDLKYDSKSEKKSKGTSKEANYKRDVRMEEKDKTKEKERSRGSDEPKRDSLKVSSSKSREEKKSEENHRKRKLDSNSERGVSKKRRHSESDSQEENENEDPSPTSEEERKKILRALSSESEPEEDIPNIEIKVEPPSPPSKMKEKTRNDNKTTKEKPRGSPSSSKLKGSSSNEKTKREEEKDKKRSDKSEDKTEHRKSEKRKDNGHHLSRESSKSKNNSSVSNSKDKIKDKDRDKDKDKNKDKDKDKHREKKDQKSSSDPKDKASSSFKEPKEKKKAKKELNGGEGIDCNSGASFAEALGMCAFSSSTSRKRNSSPNLSPAKTVKTEPGTSSASASRTKSPVRVTNDLSSSSENSPPPLLSPNVKLEPLSVDLASTLPEISPHYKPLPYVNPVHRRQEEDMALSNVIYAKNARTKVYSGNKSGYTNVPTLYDICIRILIENIDALSFTGGVPYDIIKPILERATPDQLFSLEHYNPYLIEDTDTLWQYHCNREFRTKQREEMESWREMYMRCVDEREAKLKALTANIKQSIDKSLPVRQTKLAFVDNVVKPPRNVLRNQAKYGTARNSGSTTSDLKNKLISGSGAPTNISVPAPPIARSRIHSSSVVKKTKAPLMAKALQLIKGRYKR